MVSRTSTAMALLSCLVGLNVGCQSEAKTGKIVQIGSTRASLFGPPAEFRALHPRLEDLLESRIVFRSQPGGDALAKQLAQGNINYAIMTATEFCAAQDTSNLTLLATGLNALGNPSRKALIVLRANSHVKEIADCKGKRFAFGRYKNLLTDYAAQAALEAAGVPVKKLLPDFLTPPPFAMEGRLYKQDDVSTTVAFDPLVNAGVVDEIVYDKMPATGGSLILGTASKDQLKVVAETVTIPEMVVVAGPGADAAETVKLKAYLLNEVKDDKDVCKQLSVTGFVEADRAAYDKVRPLMKKKA